MSFRIYHYDHCPYCIRARMIFGLKGLEYEDIVLGNSDEKAHIDLVGQKIVPILEYGEGKYMVESLDIVEFVDQSDGISVINDGDNSKLHEWMSEISLVCYSLVMPRFVKLKLKEFEKQEDIDYFTLKKERFIGNFDENMKKTPELISKMEKYLAELEPMLSSDEYVTDEKLTIDDICLFPILRNLTCVEELNFPDNVMKYIESMGEKSKIDLYLDRKI